MKRGKIAVIVVLGLVALIIFSPAMNKKQAARPAAPEAELTGVRVLRHEAGALVWELLTPKAVLSESGAAVKMQGVIVKLPGQGMEVSAGQGVFSFNDSSFQLSDNVNAQGNGLKFASAELNLQEGGKRIYSSSEVVLDGPSYRISGRGLEVRDQKIRLLEDVHAEFYR